MQQDTESKSDHAAEDAHVRELLTEEAERAAFDDAAREHRDRLAGRIAGPAQHTAERKGDER